jgi:hypothetical protein
VRSSRPCCRCTRFSSTLEMGGALRCVCVIACVCVRACALWRQPLACACTRVRASVCVRARASRVDGLSCQSTMQAHAQQAVRDRVLRVAPVRLRHAVRARATAQRMPCSPPGLPRRQPLSTVSTQRTMSAVRALAGTMSVLRVPEVPEVLPSEGRCVPRAHFNAQSTPVSVADARPPWSTRVSATRPPARPPSQARQTERRIRRRSRRCCP